MRRHPTAQQKQAGRPAKSPPIRTGARKPQQSRESGGSLLRPQWAIDIVAELRKVTWPSRDDTWYLTVVVLVVSIAFGVFLGGIDIFFNWLIDRTLIP